ARLYGITALWHLGAGTQARCHLNLEGAVSYGDVRLPDARLGRLTASRAVFEGDLSMTNTQVTQEADLSDPVVAGGEGLTGAVLGSLACGAMQVAGELSLRRTRVNGPARFVQGRFGRADLEMMVCQHQVVFDSAHFVEPPRLTSADLP